MNKTERERVSAKIDEAIEKLTFIHKKKTSICEIDKAIEYLNGTRKNNKIPTPFNRQSVYDKHLKVLTDEYDRTHKPSKWELGYSIPVFIGVAVVFGGTFLVYAMKWAEIVQEERVVSIIFGLGPVLIALLNMALRIYSIASYKRRLKKFYTAKNKERSKEIQSFDREVQQKVIEEKREYDKAYANYLQAEQCNKEVDEKTTRYAKQRAELEMQVTQASQRAVEIFNELEIPKPYRTVEKLTLLHAFLLTDAITDHEKNELTVKQSLQSAYESFRKSEEEQEIRELANLQEKKEWAKIQREQQNATSYSSSDTPPILTESELKFHGLFSDKELEEFANIVDNQ